MAAHDAATPCPRPGRPDGDAAARRVPGQGAPPRLPGNVLRTTTAERFDLILTPSAPGTHTVTYEFRHWLTGALAGTATAHVIVT